MHRVYRSCTRAVPADPRVGPEDDGTGPSRPGVEHLGKLVYQTPSEFRVNRVKERLIHHGGSERTEKKEQVADTYSSLCALSLRGEISFLFCYSTHGFWWRTTILHRLVESLTLEPRRPSSSGSTRGSVSPGPGVHILDRPRFPSGPKLTDGSAIACQCFARLRLHRAVWPAAKRAAASLDKWAPRRRDARSPIDLARYQSCCSSRKIGNKYSANSAGFSANGKCPMPGIAWNRTPGIFAAVASDISTVQE